MTTADFVRELYREYDWRFDEVRRLQNLIACQAQEDLRGELRKSLLLLLYAHFEGFCIFALQHYLAAVNRARLSCHDVISAVLAGAWEGVFQAMEQGDEKCKVFKQSLPDDKDLHRHWRRRHFVEDIDRFSALPVVLAEDIIDSESNLKPEVLKRNLFVLGLDVSFVDGYKDTIHNLLGRRNRVAHGDDRRPLPEQDYAKYESAVFEICFTLIDFLERAHRDESYRKRLPEYAL